MGWTLDDYYNMDTDELEVFAQEMNGNRKGSIANHFFQRASLF